MRNLVRDKVNEVCDCLCARCPQLFEGRCLASTRNDWMAVYESRALCERVEVFQLYQAGKSEHICSATDEATVLASLLSALIPPKRPDRRWELP